jgi:hypothetical protein
VRHGDESYVVRGYSRLSGDRQYLDLEHEATGERMTVPVDEVQTAPPLRLVDPPS